MTDFTTAHIATGSPLNCAHANEVPRVCPCSSSCYCKAHTCKNRNGGVADAVTEAQTHPRVPFDGSQSQLEGWMAEDALRKQREADAEKALRHIRGDDLPLFCDIASCAKCGGRMVAAKHRKAGREYDFGPTHVDREVLKPERIERTCERCGYSWDERPLDGEASR